MTKENNDKPGTAQDAGQETAVMGHPSFNLYMPQGNQSVQQDEDAWIVTYIDVLTLLLTLFVVLLYLAKTDTEKFQQFTHSLGIELNIAPAHPNAIPPIDTGLPTLPAAPQADKKSAMETLGEQLLSNIQQQGLDDSMAVTVSKTQVELRINDNILFPSGEAALLPQGAGLITKLAGLLTTEGSVINVEGHTDNIPIKNDRFPSNWELSAARASLVVRELIRHGIPAQRLRATAYADTHPVASNASAKGRSQNRRVSLVIEMAQVAPVEK